MIIVKDNQNNNIFEKWALFFFGENKRRIDKKSTEEYCWAITQKVCS